MIEKEHKKQTVRSEMGVRVGTCKEMSRGHTTIVPTASEVRKINGILKYQLQLRGIWSMEYLVSKVRWKGNPPQMNCYEINQIKCTL